MRSRFAHLALVAAVATALAAGCRDGHAQDEHAGPAAAPPSSAGAPNPVQEEMQLLLAAMRAALEGIANRDVTQVPHAIHRVHEAKAATEAALEHGSYRLPKNGDALARFKELDEAFHGHLERMFEAGAKNDVQGTSEAFAGAVRGCQGCHAEFRK